MSKEPDSLPPEKLMAYLDGELGAEEARRVEEILEANPALREQCEGMASLVGVLDKFQPKPIKQATWDHYWEEIDGRLKKPFGWTLLLVGALVLICFGTMKILYHAESLWVKGGLLLVIAGSIILFVGVLRGRLAELPHDRYRRIRR